MVSRAFLLLLLLCSCCGATPRQTHSALCDLFFPAFLDRPTRLQLQDQSWTTLQHDPTLSAIWESLEGLDRLPPTERWTRLDKIPATHRLALRRYYLGWLYGGPRGWRWAGVQQPLDKSRTPPQPPSIPPRQLSISNGKLQGTREFDYLIVGSGPAGSVLGHQLSRAGKKVLLVERGSFVLPDALDTRVYPELKVGGGAVPTRDSAILVRNGQAVGGGSTVNVDLAFAPTLPFVQSRLEGWRRSGLLPADQWTAEEVERAYDWVMRTIGTRTPTTDEINPNNDILRRGALATGYQPSLYDLNTMPGRGPATDKLSATRQLLVPAMTARENPLTLLPDFEVRKLQVSDNLVVAVEGRFQPTWTHPGVWENPNRLDYDLNATYTIRAKNYILSAGAQGSAALLLRSGVGGGTVGKGVVMHPSMPFIGLFPEEINAHQGTASTVYSVDPEGLLYECMSGTPRYVALMLDGTGEEVGERVRRYRNLGGFGVLLIDEPAPTNRIELNQAGEADVYYEVSAQEKELLRKGVYRAVRMMLSAGAEEVYIPSSEARRSDTPPGHLVCIRNEAEAEEAVSKLRFQPGDTVLTSAHMQSSCKLGSTPANSVVGPDLRVWGVDNLYVCDSSIFPTSVGANPMQTIYTVAKMTADRLMR